MRRFVSLAIVVSIYIVYEILPAEDANYLRLSNSSNPSPAEEKEREAQGPSLPTAASSSHEDGQSHPAAVDLLFSRPTADPSNRTLHSEDNDDISETTGAIDHDGDT